MFSRRPQRRFHRAGGEDPPGAGLVAQGQPLAFGREDHVMFADHIAAAQRGVADLAARTGAGLASGSCPSCPSGSGLSPSRTACGI